MQQPKGRRFWKSRLSSRAFSATELVVILAIVSILSTVSLTVFVNSHKASAVRNEASKIETLLSTARARAVAANAWFRFTYWRDRPSYWIDEIDASGAIVAPKVTTPEQVNDLVRVESVAGGIEDPATNTVSFRFRPDGSCDDGAIYLLHADADDQDEEEYYTIKLYGPTGRARVFENQRK